MRKVAVSSLAKHYAEKHDHFAAVRQRLALSFASMGMGAVIVSSILLARDPMTILAYATMALFGFWAIGFFLGSILLAAAMHAPERLERRKGFPADVRIETAWVALGDAEPGMKLAEEVVPPQFEPEQLADKVIRKGFILDATSIRLLKEADIKKIPVESLRYELEKES